MEVSATLIAVAKELAARAKGSLPELQEGEQVLREWYENGVYSRETRLNDEIFLSQYDFRQKTCRRMAADERGDRQSLTEPAGCAYMLPGPGRLTPFAVLVYVLYLWFYSTTKGRISQEFFGKYFAKSRVIGRN